MNKLLIFLLSLILFNDNAFSQININIGEKSPLRKLEMAEVAISNFYVDNIDENKLAEYAIKGMLSELDPHSTYSDAKETKALTEPLQGDFEGVGIQFNMIDDSLVVIKTVVNGPSEKVGIVPGDRIIMVNDTTIAGVKMSRIDIMKRLRGPKGSIVKLSVLRRGVKNILHFKVTRAKIPVNSINAAYMIKPNIGYVQIESFGLKTHKEFLKAIEDLKKQGMKYLIMDLQDNGGGFLEGAVRIANEFLQKDDIIVYTEGKNSPKQIFKAKGNGTLKDLPVYVLVNELSASASEIVSGTLMDNDRATIIGRRTFGKGLVQRPFMLPDGSMIRLTTAHYYIPSGRCIQKPYKKGQREDYDLDLERRFKHGELTNPDSINFADSLKYFTVRKHRTVYGGGGIMPDYFVPLDTTKFTKFHRMMMVKNIVMNTYLRYADNNRNLLNNKFKTFEKFNSKFTVPQSLIDEIITEAKKQNITPKDKEELSRTVKYLSLQIKSLIARELWTMNEYYKIWNTENDIVQKAINIIIAVR